MGKLLNVMVVDDTSVYRMIMRKVAETISGIRVSDFAANGRIALEKMARTPVDVVLLDVEMPEMDGLATLRAIKEKYPGVSVVMVSGVSRSNANIVVECLNSGALDFVTKPLEKNMELSRKALANDLAPILTTISENKVATGTGGSSLASVRAPAGKRSSWQHKPIANRMPATPQSGVVRGGRAAPAPASAAAPARPGRPSRAAAAWGMKPGLLLIGSSTGGPAALTKVLGGISAKLSIPTMIVQHMPPLFTASLAAQLSRTTGHSVQEAKDGQTLAPGKVLLAPGGKHLSVKKLGASLKTSLNDGPKVNGCRPAADVLFMSMIAAFTDPILVVILTGMGKDGANGVKGLKRRGKTFCITQNKASCVVYGMPRAVEEMGLSDVSVSLDQIGARISELCA